MTHENRLQLGTNDDEGDAMKERPILFNGEMVRAILDGRKTQTRRPVKGIALNWLHGDNPSQGILSIAPFGEVGHRLWVRETWATVDHESASYRADDDLLDAGTKWRPSIHMPRWASRINLKITDFRVERVQDISEADAEAEGVAFMRHFPDSDPSFPAKQLFQGLWDSVYNNWNDNPWVWVIEFRRLP